MDTLVVVRHGRSDPDAGGILTPEGVGRTELLAQRFKERWFGSRKVKIVTSPLVRAKQTAEIIAKAFGIGITECPELMVDDYDGDGVKGAAVSLDREGTDCEVLVAVTHQDTTAGLVRLYGMRVLNEDLRPLIAEKSHAHIVDLATGKHEDNFSWKEPE